MACFSLGAIENLLIWLVVVAAIVALVRLLVPSVLAPLGPAGTLIAGALNIILWAIVAIAVIILVFELLACVVPLHRLP